MTNKIGYLSLYYTGSVAEIDLRLTGLGKDIRNSRLGNVKNVNKLASWHAPLTSWRKAAFRSKLPAAAQTAKILLFICTFLSLKFFIFGNLVIRGLKLLL